MTSFCLCISNYNVLLVNIIMCVHIYVYLHCVLGYEQYGLMRTDDALCFKKIAGPEKPVTQKTRAKGKHL